MTELEILRGMRELIADPEHWTQGAYATSTPHRGKAPNGSAIALDESVSVDSPDAKCFCLIGAWSKVTGEPQYHVPLQLLLGECINRSDPAAFNDTHTHEEVIAALDCAIAKRV